MTKLKDLRTQTQTQTQKKFEIKRLNVQILFLFNMCPYSAHVQGPIVCTED